MAPVRSTGAGTGAPPTRCPVALLQSGGCWLRAGLQPHVTWRAPSWLVTAPPQTHARQALGCLILILIWAIRIDRLIDLVVTLVTHAVPWLLEYWPWLTG